MERRITWNRGKKAGKRFLTALFLVLVYIVMMSVTVSASGAVAKIGTKNYTSLQAAFNAVKNGQTIKLQKSITIAAGKKVTAKKNVSFTLDLNGKTIKTENSPWSKDGGYIVLEKGSMIVKNGTVTGGWEMSWIGSGIYVKKGATLIVQSKAVCGGIENCGTLKLQKGTIQEACNEGKSIVSVTGGAITGSFVSYGGKVTIENGKVTGRICIQDASLNIKGGTFKAKESSVVYGSGQVTVSGGTFSGKASRDSGSVINAGGGTWKLKNGTFQNTKGTVISIGDSEKVKVIVSGGMINGGKEENAAVVLKSSCYGSQTSALDIQGGTISSSAGSAISVLPEDDYDKNFRVKLTLSGGSVKCTSKSRPAVYVGVSKTKAAGKLSIKMKYITAKSGTTVKYNK